MDDGFIDNLKACFLICLVVIAWFVGGGLFLEHVHKEEYESYDNGFDDGINGSLEEYNYSVEYIKCYIGVYDPTNEEFIQAKYHEGFINGYRETLARRQFDKIKSGG